eukprot:SAG22_NODE_452_length_10341_cov_12.146065_7_plen_150_part_00
MQQAEKAQDTRTARSKGALGLVANTARFSPTPMELEAYANPAPGLYGQGGVPRQPEFEWKKEAADAHQSASFRLRSSYIPAAQKSAVKYRAHRRAPCDYWSRSLEDIHAAKHFNRRGTSCLLSPKRPSPVRADAQPCPPARVLSFVLAG